MTYSGGCTRLSNLLVLGGGSPGNLFTEQVQAMVMVGLGCRQSFHQAVGDTGERQGWTVSHKCLQNCHSCS